MSEKSLSSAIDEAQNILDAAKRKAEKILLDAKQEYDEAKEKGFSEGLERGKLEATEAAVRLIKDSSTIGKQLSEHAAKLAFAITEEIISKSVKLEPEIALSIALKALDQAVVGSSIKIAINPEDEKVLKNNQKLLNKTASGINVEISLDNEISRGGCVVKTDYGEIDSRISTLIDSIKKESND